jgi:hypothetical protein
MNKEKSLMMTTKLEMKKVLSSINKLIVKKDAFHTLHNLVGNEFEIRANEPIYLKIHVHQKMSPLNVLVFK